jgi:phage terminase large subunit GpA-like protein
MVSPMAKCTTCGNDYDKSFTITMGDKSGTFDSFECAVQAMAPVCAHCGCRILGHGVESGEAMFCCAHCARESGHEGLVDHGPQG